MKRRVALGEQRGGSPYASRKPPRCHESISYVGEYGSPRVRGSAWELKFDAERGFLGVSGRLWEAQSVVLHASGSSKPRKNQEICSVFGVVGRTGAAVWRVLPPLVFSRGSRLFAEKGAFPYKILTFRGGAENRPH